MIRFAGELLEHGINARPIGPKMNQKIFGPADRWLTP
jgi:hypothetical protein